MSIIWGIGLPKTGTRSLATAMQALGYKVQHHDPEIISTMIRDFDGCNVVFPINFCDFPLFDKVYPGGKFICTEREKSSWLISANLHLNYHYAVPSQRRKQLYAYWRYRNFGSLNPTTAQLLNARAEHESLVDSYFASCPERLLRLRVCHGEGWEKLCPFIGADIPPINFPKEGVAKSR